MFLTLPAPDSRPADLAEPQWSQKKAPIMTRWAKEVSPQNALPEYPRPQMVRKDWLNLNGLWDLEILKGQRDKGTKGQGTPSYSGKILVPYPVESALSGVMQRVEPNDLLVYRRTFRVPEKWKGKRTLLHFGAVDFDATVLVNGKVVGTHRGGYDGFTFDVTDFLKSGKPLPRLSRSGAENEGGVGVGDNELEVRVWDPSETGTQPHGKQYLRNEGIWYTPTSGIWQTVWLEPVGQTFVATQRVSSTSNSVEIELTYGGKRMPLPDVQLFISAPKATADWSKAPPNSATSSYTGQSDIASSDSARLSFNQSDPILWSPERPILYRYRIELWNRSVLGPKDVRRVLLDTFEGYFAFRSVTLGKDANGRTRFLLNGKPCFMVGPLDQGFWPDGLYTAPSDAALKYDLEITKRLGFNFIRKHVKVEPDRWYYHCDKMGILVFQDMPSGDKYIGGNDPDIARTPESARQFETELKAMIEERGNHPCIVGWVPYNEGWGQWDTPRIASWIKKLDPTRLVDSASGWTDRGVGDMHDIHVYPGPGAPRPEPKRAAFLGEFGGLGLPVPGHMWKATGWGYRTYTNKEELTAGLETLFANLRLMQDGGLSGAVYTQTTDVETELNGLMTYDRELIKPDADRVAKAVKKLFLPPPKVSVLVPTSEARAQEWAYTTSRSDLSDPSDTSDLAWAKPAFNDSSWKKGKGGFGTEITPGAIVGTVWNTPAVWMRRTIEIKAPAPPPSGKPAGKEARVRPFRNPHLRIHHDEDAEVYLDGKLIAKLSGYTTGYVLAPIPGVDLTPGKHVLAVKCLQTGGGQFIDVGIVDVLD
ncbi:MAG: glycoside hydrolase family 2 [Armatimonadetes bacterium]|nr:glycoside hydrolase family 2 [Armatimonadota bacterium]